MSDPRQVIADAMGHANAGRLAKARDLLTRALAKQPGHPGLNQVMALVAGREGQHDRAMYHIDRAIASDPAHAGLWHTKGLLLTNTPRRAEALKALQRCVEIDPSFAQGWEHLGTLLADMDRPTQAEVALGHAINNAPDAPVLPGAALAYARVVSHLGRAPEAITMLRRALTHTPQHLGLQAALCMQLNYDDSATPDAIAREHRRLGEMLPNPSPPLSRQPIAGRVLRIGLLSADFRTHSVMDFLRPLVEQWGAQPLASVQGSSPRSTWLAAYSLGTARDDTTAWFESRVDTWHACATASDDAIEALIRRDELDVLIDLMGLSSSPRLAVLARQPAPIVLTAIGYPNTTGIPGVTHRLVDSITDPLGAEAFASERLLRLDPCFLCYSPPIDAPAPRLESGDRITFGSFNNLAKLTPSTLNLWSRVLNAVPGSRLLLKARGLDDPGTRTTLTQRCERAGVAADRLVLEPPRPARSDHLDTYSIVHIALDPTPYAGTTTTCEALWMGVPVVTRPGQAHASRVGASLLSAVGGLNDLIAKSDDDFVRIAASLAADRNRLNTLRSDLRSRMATSPLCDAKSYASRLYQALVLACAPGDSRIDARPA